MSQNKMLIDATHAEETRVVVVRGNRVEDFDFESEHKKLIKGNIYLAKVTRVEPSLQACFVDYGGNRHGFLAFSEIHPDYYQIPTADREALMAEEERYQAQISAQEDRPLRRTRAKRGDDESVSENAADSSDEADGDEGVEETVEDMGSQDALEELPERPFQRTRRYKIQEVIKSRQIMLVQVVKEERGNKGAALTTYLSLAGRYAVLMPNTARGGGISRKITNSADRKRLKELAQDLEVPHGMGMILRTAGASRTKTEIKRDFDYLMRLWDNVREFTLQSIAPMLVYEEGSLVKRAVRDLYGKDIDEVIIQGEAAHKEAREFMRMLMPSHAKNVKLHKDGRPIFSSFGVETQLDAMFSSQVKLRSGGYLVINQTEALVSIDINSGRSTREHNIEDTALKTNLEACDEIARQLRLRDLAGLVVVDFIDMLDRRNNRAVERRLKECLKNDRARIQVGSISPFGLLEMSRQRLRAGVIEGSTTPCPHCLGSGIVRSVPSASLSLLRALEDWLMQNQQHNPVVKTRADIALYLLNNKRKHLADIEQQFAVSIEVQIEPSLIGHVMFKFERGELLSRTFPVQNRAVPAADPVDSQADEDIADAEDGDDEGNASANDRPARDQDGEEGDRKRRRRRRRRRGRGNREEGQGFQGNSDDSGANEEDAEVAAPAQPSAEDAEQPSHIRNPNRRPRPPRPERGQRHRGDEQPAESQSAEPVVAAVPAAAQSAPVQQAEEPQAVKPARPIRAHSNLEAVDPAQQKEAEQRRARWRNRFAKVLGVDADSDKEPVELVQVAAPAEPAKPKRASRKKTAEAADVPAETQTLEEKPKKGWWRRG